MKVLTVIVVLVLDLAIAMVMVGILLVVMVVVMAVKSLNWAGLERGHVLQCPRSDERWTEVMAQVSSSFTGAKAVPGKVDAVINIISTHGTAWNPPPRPNRSSPTSRPPSCL